MLRESVYVFRVLMIELLSELEPKGRINITTMLTIYYELLKESLRRLVRNRMISDYAPGLCIPGGGIIAPGSS